MLKKGPCAFAPPIKSLDHPSCHQQSTDLKKMDTPFSSWWGYCMVDVASVIEATASLLSLAGGGVLSLAGAWMRTVLVLVLVRPETT